MSKPAFNPNQPFTEVKPKFDPSKPFEEIGSSEDPSQPIDVPQSIRSVLEGLTGSRGEEITAAQNYPETLASLARPGVEIPSMAGLEQQDPGYQKALIQEQIKGQQFKKQNPELDLGLQLGAGLVPMSPMSMAGESIIGAGMKVAKPIVKKVASALTGVPEKIIETYSKKTKEIDGIIKQYGSDLSAATDDARRGFKSAIESKTSELARRKAEVLGKSEEIVDISPVFQKLLDAKKKVNQKLYPELFNHIQDTANRVMQAADGSFAVPAIKADEIKMFLQVIGESAYNKGGQIFVGADKADKAYAAAASIARKEINKKVPDVVPVNQSFEAMFKLNKKINKNLIDEGRPDAALFSAGAGYNRNRKNLERLGSLVDSDMVGKAESLAAARQFSDSSILPNYTTGKAMAAMGLGAGAGYATGNEGGAIAGAVLSSPLALRQLIKLGGTGIPRQSSRIGIQGINAADPLSLTEEELMLRLKALEEQ